MQFKLFALVAALNLATLAAATPLDNRAAAGCVYVPISQGCASDWASCGLNSPGNAVKCCEIVCQ